MAPELEEETSNAEVMSRLFEGKAGTLMQLSGEQQLFEDGNHQKGRKEKLMEKWDEGLAVVESK